MIPIRSFDCSDNGCIARVPCAESETCKRAKCTIAAHIEANREVHNTHDGWYRAFDAAFKKHWVHANEEKSA